MNRRNLLKILVIVLFTVITCQVSFAGTGPSHQPPNQTRRIDRDTHFDVNSIDMFVTNHGSFAYDIPNGQSGLEYPKGSGKYALYAGGLWVGGKVNDDLRVVVSEYAYEYTPGPWQGVIEAEDDYPDLDRYRVYKVNKSDGPENPDWLEWPVEDGAPFIDVDSNGVYDPYIDSPEILGDQTLWCIYNDGWKANHTNSAGASDPLGLEVRQTVFGFNSPGALGSIAFIKFEFENKADWIIDSCYVSVWGDPDVGDANDDFVGCDTTLSLGFAYNSTNDDSRYGATPPALGYDFFKGPIGDDGEILPMTSFNRYTNGTDPQSPIETYWFMQGLAGDSDGDPQIDPNTGEVTKYMLTGNPVTGEGWLDSDAADRRFMCNSGPFTFEPGEIQEVVVAVVAAGGSGTTDRLQAVNLLKIYDDVAQQTFDIDFLLPSAPDSPTLETHTFEDQKILLTWDDKAENYPQEKHNVPLDEEGEAYYQFEGYVIYQGESQTGPWTRVATYDIAGNEQTMMWNLVTDPASGENVWKPVIFGGDNGVRYEMEITKDYIQGGPLRNGTPYYFAVTAYAAYTAYDGQSYETVPSFADPSRMILETSINPERVIPYYVKAGDDYSGVEGWEEETDIAVFYHQETDTLKPTTDRVIIEVVDPTLTTGHNYELFWTSVEPDSFGNFPTTPTADPASYEFAWNLLDVNTGELILENMWNKEGDERYPIVDGIKVKVSGGYGTELDDRPVDEWWIDNPELEDNDNGLGVKSKYKLREEHNFFGGGIDYGINFHGEPGGDPNMNFGSTLDPVAEPEKFSTVHIIWKNNIDRAAYDSLGTYVVGEPAGQYGYRYTMPNIAPQFGYFKTPIEVWEVNADGEYTRQLNFCFTEKFASSFMDGVWCPPLFTSDGKEYFFIMNSTYDPNDTEGMAYGPGNDERPYGLNADVLYAGWLQLYIDDRTSEYVTIEEGDILELKWVNRGDENDYYTFKTEAMISGDPKLIKSALDDVGVVPNPYYGTSTYELNQFNRIVKFIGLPQTCDIRIFNVAGHMVAKLEKDDESPELIWNLRTDNNLPVASGAYIYHVTAFEPGTNKEVATKVGKMIIFVEEERLNTY